MKTDVKSEPTPMMKSKFACWRRAALLSGFVLLAAGCSSEAPTGTVTGTVTLAGKPYEDAAVMFLDPTTGQASGADIEAGASFSLPAPLPVGTYNIYLAPKSVPMEEGSPQAVKIDETVPAKYWNEASTDLSTTVEEGENPVEVTLENG